jgi:hypothetical protein
MRQTATILIILNNRQRLSLNVIVASGGKIEFEPAGMVDCLFPIDRDRGTRRINRRIH